MFSIAFTHTIATVLPSFLGSASPLCSLLCFCLLLHFCSSVSDLLPEHATQHGVLAYAKKKATRVVKSDEGAPACSFGHDEQWHLLARSKARWYTHRQGAKREEGRTAGRTGEPASSNQCQWIAACRQQQAWQAQKKRLRLGGGEAKSSANSRASHCCVRCFIPHACCAANSFMKSASCCTPSSGMLHSGNAGKAGRFSERRSESEV